MKKIYILLGLISFVIIVNAQNPVLYALTSAGGTTGKGTIIKYDVSNNQLSATYSFSGPDGEAPQGSLVQASNGLFYGMTRNGGVNNLGVIFSFNPCTNTYTKLYEFGGVDGARPHGSLIQASNGILYGMTTFGGTLDRGVIFSYNIEAGVYTKLHDFTGPINGGISPNPDDGSLPYGSLLQATDGKLYGMTSSGGLSYFGIAFSFDIASSSLVKLWYFGSNGGPMASFIQAADGFLYYTTNGGAGQSSRVLLGYLGSTKSGFVPRQFGTATGVHALASLLQASNGKLYGTTIGGGTPDGLSNLGVVYSFDPLTYEYKAISFNGVDGANPGGSLMEASNGTLYGMTTRGGLNGLGVIYSLDITTFTRSKLQDFSGSNGANPALGHFTELKIKCPAPVDPGITFTLINSTNDLDIQTLKDGDSINLATLSTTNLNIRATSAALIGSMVFNLSGAQTVNQTESVSPYALFGDNGGDYYDWTPAVGNYTLKATPFSEGGGTGTAGTAATINFKVVNIPSITFTLINSTNDLDIQTLRDGDSINLATLSTTNLNIRATSASSIGSMVFNLSGAQTVNQTESVSPYALFGDNSGDYNDWTPAVGNYTLKATPFSEGGGTGTAGTAATINFKVINKPPNGARIALQNVNAVVPQANQLNVYPNPSITGRFTINLPNKYQGEISYSLVSMLGKKITVGKLVLKEPTSTVNFDFSHQLISSGIYYLILEGKGLKKLQAKLMKGQ